MPTVLYHKVFVHLTLLLDYISYVYNNLFCILFRQKPSKVHIPSEHYHPAVLITGTSVGIGRETALTLAKLGYTVFAGVRKNDDADDLTAVFKDCYNPKEGRLIPIILDVTNNEHIQNAYDQIQSIIGHEIPFVALINNAALVVYLPMEIASEDAFLHSFNTNYFSIVNLTKKFLPLLRQSGGRVINLGSVAAWESSAVMGIYAATKAAVRAMTKIWRVETKEMGVHFSLIEPGVIISRLNEQTTYNFRNFESFSSLTHYYSSLQESDSKVIVEYEKMYKAIAKCSENFRVSPTEIATDAILHALTAPYPKNTYYVGLDAKTFAFVNWLLGDRFLETVQSKVVSFISKS
ncbi:hypothetical protein C2G38_2139959 [Gigaspora rosea]|uniref:Oxidoreductase n=1 Tax=Gigaspora rosea TaxID=44941 RepID=A0A397VKF5_9GLOM|nr:hypothetical protein C2G38_2139959 [Gigaspora rosea]